MNTSALLFLLVNVAALMFVPRKWAPIPLLASCFYMTIGQGVEVGPISLPIYRLILAAGLLRILLRGERLAGKINVIDKLVIVWAAWMIFASFFHESGVPGAGPIYASGFVFNVFLVYFLSRVWCETLNDLVSVLTFVAWLLVPVALAMIAEHVLLRNYFGALFGGVSDGVYVRDGSVRAQGPFVHPLVAGTIGATTFPLMIGIRRFAPISALLGIAATLVMVVASTSSGPLMSLFIAIFGLFFWLRPSATKFARWGLLGIYLAAEIYMTRPAYYLISMIDLTGSSTGWHRSRLIEQAFSHIHEWWLFGTDFTFHWMGIAVDEGGRHSDITNYYLWIGIIGGLPAMALIIAILWLAFRWVGRTAATLHNSRVSHHAFLAWCLGAGLLAHAVTSLSMSYTDQSVTFFWLNVGAISSLYTSVVLGNTQERYGAKPHSAQPTFTNALRGQQPQRRRQGYE